MFLKIKEKLYLFPKIFWIGNSIELFERFAFYGFYIALTLYLTKLAGFNDIQMGYIAGTFSALLYLLPIIAGAFADKITYRTALIFAFLLLSGGYFILGIYTTKITTLIALTIIAFGGSIVKPVISATVSKSSNENTAKYGFSIFYWVVNIGGFLGKTFAYPLRIKLGIQYITFFSSLLAIIAVFIVFIFYKPKSEEKKERENILKIFIDIYHAFTNWRLISFLFILGGFWILFIQLYFTIPLYVIRTLGEEAAPEWMVNINPLMIVIFQLPITALLRKIKALHSIILGYAFIILAMLILSIKPNVYIIITGIAFVALGEMTNSPRALEFISSQATAGQEGLYMGAYYISIFFGNFFGGILSGKLLSKYCPETGNKLYASRLWLFYAAIGAAFCLSLYYYSIFTRKKDTASNY